MEKKDVITELLKNGGTQVNGLKVKNVTVTPLENYVRLGLTLDKPVKGMVSEDKGVTYKEGDTKVIFVSLYSVTSILKDDDNAAFAANYIINNPESVMIILSGATINIIQEHIKTGTEYRNPWSENADVTVFDHDTVINHVLDIKIGKLGNIGLNKIADKLLGL